VSAYVSKLAAQDYYNYITEKVLSKNNPRSGQVSEVSVSPFCKMYLFHSMSYVGVKASIMFLKHHT